MLIVGTNVVISNRSALIAKYGPDGQTQIENAVFRLLAAYSECGIEAELFYLDELPPLYAITNPSDQEQNKRSISWILRKPKDSLLIVGGPEIVPHEDYYRPAKDCDCLHVTTDELKDSNNLNTTSKKLPFAVIQAATRLLTISESSSPSELIHQIDFAANRCEARKQLFGTPLKLQVK
jgi:hypothetical protein